MTPHHMRETTGLPGRDVQLVDLGACYALSVLCKPIESHN